MPVEISLLDTFDVSRFGSYLNAAEVADESLVCAFASGQVVRVCRRTLRPEAEAVAAFGLKFDQPVALNAIGSNFYVSDWGNHRIVVLDADLKPLTSLGVYRSPAMRGLRGRLAELRTVASRRSVIGDHTSGDHDGAIRTTGAGRMRKLARHLGASIRGDGVPVGKPNGVARKGNALMFADKEFRCITSVDLPSGQLTHMHEAAGVPFGRLGGCGSHGKRFFVCDEPNHRVVLGVGDHCEEISTGSFRPFCATFIDEQNVILGGVEGLVSLDRSAREMTSVPGVTDVHSIVRHGGLFFAAVRGRSLVHALARR